MSSEGIANTENQNWFVYLLECADGTTYIGATKDVDRRVREHNDGVGARYTRGRRPVNLLGSIQCATQGDALRQERQLKMLGPQGRRQAFNVK